jgi:hypothetical protein
MNSLHLACVVVFLLAGVAHVYGLWRLRLRVDELARQGLLKRGGLSFFFGNYLTMLRSVDDVLQRIDVAPDRRVRWWAYFARNSFYVAIFAGFGGFLIQAVS